MSQSSALMPSEVVITISYLALMGSAWSSQYTKDSGSDHAPAPSHVPPSVLGICIGNILLDRKNQASKLGLPPEDRHTRLPIPSTDHLRLSCRFRPRSLLCSL